MDIAVAVFDDDHPGARPYHLAALTEHHLDLTRVLVGPRRQLQRCGTGLHVGQPHVASLGLGDDFLRYHQHVTRLQLQIVVPQGVSDQLSERIPRLHQGKSLQRNQLQPGSHQASPRPLILIPA